MFKKAFTIIGLITLFTSQINAQDFYLGPQIGYHKALDADDGKFMVGAAFRLHLTKSIGAEVSTNSRSEEYLNGALSVKSWPIMITGLFYPIPTIYGAIGVGWYYTTFDFEQSRLPIVADKTKQPIGWHFGGGVELPVGNNSKFIGDIRYVFLDYDFDSIPGVRDKSSDFYVFSLSILLGL